MTYTVKSPLTKTSGHYTADQLWAAFKPITPPDQYANAQRVLKALVPLCIAFDLDEVALAAIIWIETGAANTGLPFRSSWYLNGFNLGNIGITGDPAQNAAAQKWTTPEDGVLGLVAHAVAYAYGSAWRSVWDVDQYGKPQIADKRFDLVLKEYGGQALNSLEALNGRWAWDVDNNYDGKLAERANKIVAAIGDDPPVETPSTPPEPIPGEGEPPMATVTFGKVPRPAFTNREIPTSQNTAFDYLGQREVRGIFLHRMEGSLWGTDEYFRTMANAAKTRQGGLTDFGTDATTGEALMWCNSSGTKSPWASGPVQNPIKSAAIFVNLYGRNAVNQYAESIETSGWGDDAVSAKWRAWVVAEIAYQADDYGRKLAAKGEKFDYTTYPNIPSEQNREFVMSHGWSYDGKRNTCAGSVIEALIPTINKEVKAILTAAQSSGVTPEPVYAPAHPVSKGSQIINDHQFLAPGGKTFQRDTIPSEWGDGKDNPTGPTIKKGTKITDDQISHYVQGTDGNLYLVLTGVSGVADGSRVPAEAVIAA